MNEFSVSYSHKSPLRAAFIRPETLAAGLLLASSGLHIWLLPHAFQEATYNGIFMSGYVLLSFICALDLTRLSRIAGWFGGAFACMGSLIVSLASLCTSLPFAFTVSHFHLQIATVLAVAIQCWFLALFVHEIVLADEED